MNDRGLHGDTIYIELSHERPGLQGFIYPYDSSRMFVSVPFHLAYVLSSGSYFSLHLVFGLLVWLTGYLTYRVMKAFVPDAEFLSFASGAIALTHGADTFMNLVTINMVRQAVVCMLAAILIFRVAWLKNRPILLVFVALAQFVSLWTYEAGLPIILFVPFLLLLDLKASWRRRAAWAVGWTFVPLGTAAAIVYRYLIRGQTSYQSSQLSQDWSIAETITRLWTFAQQGLAFWRWPELWTGLQQGCEDILRREITAPLTIGIVAFAAAAWPTIRSDRSQAGPLSWLKVFCIAAIYLALGYGVYLTLAADRVAPAWRTHFFAAPPAAIMLAACAGLLDRIVRARGLLAAGICTAVVGFGVYGGLMSQIEQTRRWEPYRQVMAAIVEAAPRIKDDTLVALVGAPPVFFHTLCPSPPVPNPPFEDGMWFNSALQVMYPDTRLVGLYWWGDEKKTAPGSLSFRFDEKGATMEHTFVDLDGTAFGYDQMIAFAWDHDMGAILLPSFPSDGIPGAVSSANYSPLARILPGPPPVETVRKLVH